MDNFIDRVAFREHLDSVYPFTKTDQRDSRYDYAKSVFLIELARFPAADVRPVARGKWRKADNPSFSPFDDSGAYIFFCSVCGKSHGHAYRFCPSCGADMRGGGGNG